MSLEHVLHSSVAIGACVFLLWLISIRMRDASIADIWWGPGFAVIAWLGALNKNLDFNRHTLVALVMTLWALRLAYFLARRNLGHGEDRRYQAMRGDSPHFWWVSLFKVFLLQGALQLIVSLPVFATAHAETPMNAWDVVGISIALVGIVTEALADHQLTRFKADPNNKGRVMNQGLWGHSRHPNYFGNAVLWVGIGIVGIAAGGPWWALAGPVLMIFLLLKVSGVSMLEATITERRPAYRQYMMEVSAFVPWPKKR
jgi:steroid 5-alpha reductase family enzyme